jgi:two-component system cell cycle response regulator
VYDVAGRYGGEEFCIVLPETKVGNTSAVADRIRSKMETTPLQIGGVLLNVTASIGIAGVDSAPSEGLLSPAALIDRADRALYSAKHRGRNRIEFWNEPEIGH